MTASRAPREGAVGAVAGWLASLLVAMVGIGLVMPGGGVATPAAASPLIGPRTGDVLVIPALKVRAPLVSVKMDDDKVLTPPRNPREVGWWDQSAEPGSRAGQTLITGHTVHTGGGALDRLGDLKVGQPVRIVRTAHGRTLRTYYEITSVRTMTKAEVAKKAVDLFGQSRTDARLVLVTCTGWDGKDYSGNVVVFAERLRSETIG